MFKLIIQDDEGKTTVVPLIREEITIGRKEGNTIRLTERNVSRRHARIIKQNGNVFVEDFDSYNGIRVNGSRIAGRIAVQESDRIQIGDYLIELKLDKPNQPANDRTDPLVAAVPFASPNDPTAPHAAIPGQPVAPFGQAAAPAAREGTATQTVFGLMAPDVSPKTTAVLQESSVPARVFVVSANFAGQEFVLDKPTMVIGRTKDNDIVIDHRSISRHHAKIVIEQGQYHIVDLQSSNGVRVNGEDYGKTELRKGDLVDLGHVRMRFVAPGEDFVFARDAQIIDPQQVLAGSRRTKYVAIGAVVLLCGVGALFASGALGGKKNKKADSQKIASATTGIGTSGVTGDVVDPTSATSAALADTGPPVVAPSNGQNSIEQARGALADERWSDALGLATQALAVDSASAAAKEIKTKAESELRAQVVFETLKKKARAKQWEDVLESFSEIGATSVYYAKAEPDALAAKTAYLVAQERLIDRAIGARRCDEARALAEHAAILLTAERERLTAKANGCKAEPAVVATVKTVDKTAASTTQTTGREPAGGQETTDKTPAVAPTPKQLVDEAKEAMGKGQWAAAFRKADDALEADPGSVEALSLAAMASCKMKKVDKAASYLGRIKGQRQSLVRQYCGNSGVTLP